MNSKHPLGLPQGSVRALLSIVVVGVIFGRYAITGDPPSGELLLTSGGVLAAYGLSRAVTK